MHALHGFTLVEVMLAVTMVVALMLALFAFYIQTMDVRAASSDDAELMAAERGLMETLTNELRAATTYPLLNIGLEGAADQITFITTAIPGPAAWAIRTSMDDPIPPEQDAQLVQYGLRVDSNTGQVLGLERLCQKVISATAPEKAQQVYLISSRLCFLNFRYYDGTGWTDTWSPSGGDTPTSLLPMAVEITIGFDPKPEEMTVEDFLLQNLPRFQRVVFVPAGARPQTGTVVRGAGGPLP